MIRWLFIDVGNVILNDDPLMAIIYKRTYDAIREAGHPLRFEDLLRRREEQLRLGEDGEVQRKLAIEYLGVKGYRKLQRVYHRYVLDHLDQLYHPIPGILPALRSLRQRAPMALLANQPASIEKLLRKYQVWDLFERHFISEALGLQKPDPEFFRHALAETGCGPDEAIMIGDRRDNDILPARKVGMHTIWFVPPLEDKGYTPKEDWEKLFFASLRRTRHSDRAFPDPNSQPDFVARSVGDLVVGVDRIIENAREQDATR